MFIRDRILGNCITALCILAVVLSVFFYAVKEPLLMPVSYTHLDVYKRQPNALTVAVSAAQAVERIGLPEGQIPLAQAVAYVATAPKSNAACLGIFKAMEAVRSEKTPPVPAHLQDKHYKGAEKLGHGLGYKYAHDYPRHYVKQQYLPDGMEDCVFY